jgi:hypothetical protein
MLEGHEDQRGVVGVLERVDFLVAFVLIRAER